MSPQSAIIVGGDSFIGQALIARLSDSGCTIIRTSRRRDIHTNPDTIGLDLLRPDCAAIPDAEVAFICAGMTNMAACRENPELADSVNNRGPVQIAQSLASRGIKVVYLSTAAVLDCREPQMLPDRPRNAASIYGITKGFGEVGILTLRERVCVVRLTKVLPERWPLILDWQSKFRQGICIEAFVDHSIAPLLVEQVVPALIQLSDRATGIYQISGARDISYYEIARFLAKQEKVSSSLARPVSAASRGIPLEEILPYTSLDCSSSIEIIDFRPPDPVEILENFFST